MKPTYEELEDRVVFLEGELVIERDLTNHWRRKVDELYESMWENPVSNPSLRHRLHWYQRRYAPLVKRMYEAERFQNLPIGEIAKVAIQRGRTIHRLERKLSKRNRLSAKQHRFLKEKNTSSREIVASQTLGW